MISGDGTFILAFLMLISSIFMTTFAKTKVVRAGGVALGALSFFGLFIIGRSFRNSGFSGYEDTGVIELFFTDMVQNDWIFWTCSVVLTVHLVIGVYQVYRAPWESEKRTLSRVEILALH